MIQYLNKVHEIQSAFDRVVLTKIPRENNVRADALSKMGSEAGLKMKNYPNEVMLQSEPSILPKREVMTTEEESTDPEWAT